MKKILLLLLFVSISLMGFGQKHTLESSPNDGYFMLDSVDYVKGSYDIIYGGSLIIDSLRRFSLVNIFTEKKIISSRYFEEIEGVNSWDELSQLLKYFGVLSGTNILTPYELGVNQGRISGSVIVDKFGLNPLIEVGVVPADIWENGGTYPYDSDSTAPIMYLSSSNILDSVDVRVSGLGIYGDEVIQTITLEGQTVVNLTTPLWRVYRLENEGSNDLIGMCYCHTDPTPTNGVPVDIAIRALIDNGNNQTLMTLITIPKGKVGFLYRGEAGMEYASGSASQNVEFATIYYNSRRYGKVFKIKKVISLISSGNSNYSDPRSFPDIIPALTDVKLTVKEVSNDMGIWATFDIELIDEELFSDAYLKAIGQPNY